jgi:hypothetical protein
MKKFLKTKTGDICSEPHLLVVPNFRGAVQLLPVLLFKLLISVF